MQRKTTSRLVTAVLLSVIMTVEAALPAAAAQITDAEETEIAALEDNETAVMEEDYADIDDSEASDELYETDGFEPVDEPAEPSIGEAPLPEGYEAEESAVYETVEEDSEYTEGEDEFEEALPTDYIGLGVEERTKNEIWKFIKDNPAPSISTPEAYATSPSLSKPFSIGSLKSNALNAGLNAVNQIRYAAGLDVVGLSTEYNRYCQSAAFLNTKNNKMSHFPVVPPDMTADDPIVVDGQRGAGESNIAWGYGSLANAVYRGWLHDSDSNNIDRVGHRRWILYPYMKQTGFGHVGSQMAMYSFDGTDVWHDPADAKIVAMPSQNMPLHWIDPAFAWSVSFGRTLDINKVNVRLIRDRDNKTWIFSQSKKDGYYNIENSGYGDKGCVIFRPNGISYSAGDTFTVVITGAMDKPLLYTVDIFSATGATAPEQPPESVSFPQDEYEIPVHTSYKLSAKVLPEKASQKVTWTSGDDNVATVAPDGTVSALMEGSTTITATTVQNGADDTPKSATVTVNVVKPKLSMPSISPATGTVLDEGDEITIESGSRHLEGVSYTMYYSVDGGAYMEYKDSYAVPDSFCGRTFVIKAYESADGYTDSDEISAEYTVTSKNANGDVDADDITGLGGEPIPQNIWIAGLKANYDYTGKPVTEPQLRVYCGNKKLLSGTDYSLKYTNNINAGTASVTVNLRGNYNAIAPIKYDFKINEIELNSLTVSPVILGVKKDAKGNPVSQKPVPEILWNGKKLPAKTGGLLNYELSYHKSTDIYFSTPVEIKEAGDYVAYFTGIHSNNFSGYITAPVTVYDTVVMSNVKASGYSRSVNFVYDIPGGIQKPDMTDFTLKNGKDDLSLDDFDISFDKATEAGTGYIVVKPKALVADMYKGELRLPYTIKGAAITSARAEYNKTWTYTGEMIQPGIKLTGTKYVWNTTENVAEQQKNVVLTAGLDYEISPAPGEANIKTRSGAYMLVKGLNGFTGTAKKKFTIVPFDLTTAANVKISNADGEFGTAAVSYPYLKKGAKPDDMKVEVGTKVLEAGKDYTLSWSNNTAVAAFNAVNPRGKSIAPTVTVKGKGNYKGKTLGTFTIKPVNISKLTLYVDDIVNKGKANSYRSVPAVYDAAGTKLAAGRDYEKNPVYTYTEYTEVTQKGSGGIISFYRTKGEQVDPKDILPTGTVLKVTVTGKGNYKKSDTEPGDEFLSGTFKVSGRSIKEITFRVDNFEYTGEKIRPHRVEYNSDLPGIHACCRASGDPSSTVDAKEFYRIVGYSNNIKRGTGKITVRGTNGFAGTKTITFKIVPKKTGK